MRTETFGTAPKIEIRKLDETNCEFYLTGTDVSIANALRRVILAEVCDNRLIIWVFLHIYTRTCTYCVGSNDCD